jgi:hypothetical protein
MNNNEAHVTILGPVQSRTIETKNGQKTLHEQKASLETEAMRVTIEVGVDGPNAGYAVGGKYRWNVAADLVPGRFGVELARRMTLEPLAVAEAVKPRATANA